MVCLILYWICFIFSLDFVIECCKTNGFSKNIFKRNYVYFVKLVYEFVNCYFIYYISICKWYWNLNDAVFNKVCFIKFELHSRTLLVRIPLWCSVLHTTLCDNVSVTWGRSVVFYVYSGFPHQYNWPPRYSWNIIESGVKHHKPRIT